MILILSKYVLILLSIALIVRCIRSMLSEHYEPEIWGYLRHGNDTFPLTHWENLIGRALNADVRLVDPGVSRVHAVLRRGSRGTWRVYDIFSKGGVWIKNAKAGPAGLPVEDGDVINVGGQRLRFRAVTPEKWEKLEKKRTSAGRRVSPAVTLLELTVFQLFLLLQHAMSASPEDLKAIALAWVALIALQWACYNAMRFLNRSGFEIETLAFYLTTLGMSVVASSVPGDMLKQLVLTMAAVVLFLLLGLWLRKLERAVAARFTVEIIALGLMAVTGAGMAGFLAVSIKPYIARRFSTWGHVWEDVYGAGFQQTRAISAAAAGGLYGKGAGAGWLKGIFAANTDMVFALICEEQGLIIGVIMVAAMLTLAFFAVRTARQGRSAFYSIAACAAMSMLLVQLAMNVFGSLDLLPFTGVTFPFVSKGGTSLLSSWMMMAFIKSADNRRDASFAVNAALEDKSAGRDEDPSDWEVWQPREK